MSRSYSVAVRMAEALVLSALVAACATPPAPSGATFDRIGEELRRASASPTRADDGKAQADALLPPLQVELPKTAAESTEPRFDLIVNGAPATEVFTAIASGTRYSMLLAPDVSGSISVSLKNVTVREALDSIREIYGYDYKIVGTRVHVHPNSIQSKVFQVNYLSGRRQGQSDLRVVSNSITTAGSGSGSTSSSATPPPTGSSSAGTPRGSDSARVSTTLEADFWGELRTALTTMIGNEGGRSVVVNPMSGVVVVRGLPADIRNVENYLRATRLMVERQVMLEAKIVEVALNEEFQAGINWAGFRTSSSGNSRFAGGVAAPNTVLRPSNSSVTTGTLNIDPSTGAIVAFPDSSITTTLSSGALSNAAGDVIIPGATGAIAAAALGNGLIGLALQTANFSALLNFLETQGGVQVLSSPRIATLNNQQAILKVGADEFYVTNVTTTTNTSAAGNTSSPSITLQPFFSGISLDVTPQIDDANNITLHVHPAVSVVSEKQKLIDLGSLGQFSLPLATSSINETDSIVRVRNGNIVAIGGLMRQEQSSDRRQLPGLGDAPGLGALFGQRGSSSRKREMVILIKPTIIHNEVGWNQDLEETQHRLRSLDPRRPPGGG